MEMSETFFGRVANPPSDSCENENSRFRLRRISESEYHVEYRNGNTVGIFFTAPWHLYTFIETNSEEFAKQEFEKIVAEVRASKPNEYIVMEL